MRPPFLVVGVGNPDCADDGVGPLVARQLAGHDVAVMECRGDLLAMIEDWAGRDGVIIVDAAESAGQPGRIHRIDLLRDGPPLQVPELAPASTHGFGVADAVGLARVLGMLPRSLIVYAIEGGAFTRGAAMTPEIAGAVPQIILGVTEDLDHLRRRDAERH